MASKVLFAHRDMQMFLEHLSKKILFLTDQRE